MWKGLKYNDLDLSSRYEVTEDGYVRNTRGKILKQRMKNSGYMEVVLHIGGRKLKSASIHRCVASTFLPNPNNYPEINHKDGNKLNNTLDNLEWCTALYNRQHAKKLGLIKAGAAVSHAKLTNDDVLYIRKHYIYGHPKFGAAALAEKYGITKAGISRALRGNSYSNVQSGEVVTIRRSLTPNEVKYVRQHYIPYHKDFGAKALAKRFGVSRNTIMNIASRKTFSDVI